MSVAKLNHPQAKKLMDSEPKAVIIDVRTAEEFGESRIDGAINIPLDILEKEIIKIIPNKNQPVIVYCQSGRRSKQAAELLDMAGYENIYDMGGLTDWPFELIM